MTQPSITTQTTNTEPVKTRYSVSVLSTHTVDSKPCLLLTFQDKRYLFNTPESTSRICVQNKTSLKKIGQTFLGQLEQSLGLPGFVLSSVESGNNKLQVFGPNGLKHYLATCRYFTRREQLSLQANEIGPDNKSEPCIPKPTQIFADNNITVHALPLTATVNSTHPRSLKRKRSQTSFSSSSPELSPNNHSNSTPVSSSKVNKDMSSPSFRPRQLEGDAAAEWRTHVLSDMFRGTEFGKLEKPTRLSSSSNLSTRSSSNETMGTELFAKSQIHRGRTPAYLLQPLPPAFDHLENVTSRQTTTVSYIVVGPTIRGKFQPQIAIDKGVKPGTAFKRLIAGERVWVPKSTLDPSNPSNDQSKNTSIKNLKKETKKERLQRIQKEKEMNETKTIQQEGIGQGHWVEPEECLSEGEQASGFVVLNIPSTDYLDSLSSVDVQSITNVVKNGSIKAIYYFLGSKVLQDARLHTFMNSITHVTNNELEHRISSSDIVNHNPMTFVHSALLTLRLNLLEPKVFSIPHYSFLTSNDVPLLDSSKEILPKSLKIKLLQPNQRFSQTHQPIEPDLGVEYRHFNFKIPSIESNIEISKLKPSFKSNQIQQLAKEAWSNYIKMIDQVKLEIKEKCQNDGDDENQSDEFDIEITPLGTGSAIPSKYRNVSSTLIHLPNQVSSDSTNQDNENQSYILFDAGEGTWGQLTRRFGLEKSKQILRNLKLISISHLHQDHHAGLTHLLIERNKLSPAPREPLMMIVPQGVRLYLTEQQELFDLGLGHSNRTTKVERDEPGRNIVFVDCGVIEHDGRSLSEDDWRIDHINEFKNRLDLKQVATVPVQHRCKCWGIVVESNSGWKITFSGDTMPCDALVKAGQGSTLLIHEATIQDDMPEVAYAKGHSTFGQAINVAKRMRAKHLLLTHFSARYPKLPPMMTTQESEKNQNHEDPIVALAFDLASLKLKDFWKTKYWSKAMDTLFSWDEVEESKDTNELVKKKIISEDKVDVAA
ncbi:hypothetical protein OIO90_003209 [Microbotryomycetes sp. JL221]|nr:hypothetical protein OIO90_003209 [Microbotryomycetes sp. JL221]